MVKKLDQLSPDERDSFARQWANKAIPVNDTAKRFGVSERTARDWADEHGIERGGRGFGKTARQPRIVAMGYAGRETEADPANVYDRATVNGADGFYVERAREELGEATAREWSRAALDMLHKGLSDWTGAGVLTDDGEFVTVEAPTLVSSSSVEMKVLTLRLERRQTKAGRGKGE